MSVKEFFTSRGGWRWCRHGRDAISPVWRFSGPHLHSRREVLRTGNRKIVHLDKHLEEGHELAAEDCRKSEGLRLLGLRLAHEDASHAPEDCQDDDEETNEQTHIGTRCTPMIAQKRIRTTQNNCFDGYPIQFRFGQRKVCHRDNRSVTSKRNTSS